MIIPYNKRQKKIAMGMLGFHKNIKAYQHLLTALDWYEQKPDFLLCFWKPTEDGQIQGLVGYQLVGNELIVHDISLNPSYRSEGYGFIMLDELQEVYPECHFMSTVATGSFLSKWQARE